MNSTTWRYAIGDGCPDICGWGNNEQQYYTNRPSNVQVQNGSLKITARRENYENKDFTSARLFTKDRFEFQYGRVEIRAKYLRDRARGRHFGCLEAISIP